MDSSAVGSTSSTPAKSSVGVGEGSGLGDSVGDGEGDGVGEGEGSVPDEVLEVVRRRLPEPEPVVVLLLVGAAGWVTVPDVPGLPCSEVPLPPGSEVPPDLTSEPSLPGSPPPPSTSTPGSSPPMLSPWGSAQPPGTSLHTCSSTLAASAEGVMAIKRMTSVTETGYLSNDIVRSLGVAMAQGGHFLALIAEL